MTSDKKDKNKQSQEIENVTSSAKECTHGLTTLTQVIRGTNTVVPEVWLGFEVTAVFWFFTWIVFKIICMIIIHLAVHLFFVTSPWLCYTNSVMGIDDG